MKKLRRRLSEELLIQPPCLEFPALRIFAPRDKESFSLAVIGLFQESIPEEWLRSFPPFRESAQALMEIGSMVEGVPLTEDRDLGQRPVTLHKMGQVGMGLPALIGKG